MRHRPSNSKGETNVVENRFGSSDSVGARAGEQLHIEWQLIHVLHVIALVMVRLS
jgi:hypothetical protein